MGVGGKGRARSDPRPAASDGARGDVDLSVVIPVYDEAENVAPLMEALERHVCGGPFEHEIVFVDDGSTDGTAEALAQEHERHSCVKVVRLRRNFGQTAALAAGIAHADGAVIVTMDGDLQNDPEDISVLVSKLEEGYDIVSGWRQERHDAFLSRKLPSLIANKLISRVSGIPLHDWGCTLKAYRREVLKQTPLYGELHRFIPAVAQVVGARVAELPVRHHPRRFGRSKYGLTRTVRVLLDLLTVSFLVRYRTRPLHFFGTVGFVSAALGVLSGLTVVAMKLLQGVDMSGNPLIILSAVLLLGGAQFVSIGLLGEITMRTYYESQEKPIYVVREVLEHESADG